MPLSPPPSRTGGQKGFFLYSRKSSEAEDRQILSIESQIEELKQVAEKLGLPVLDTLSEARSAKAPGRPVFDEMMRRIYRGEADGILCWKLDRLARNPVDGGSIIWAMKQQGIRIVTPTQTYSQEDDNLILMYIEFGMAHKYIDDLSRNVKRGLEAKVKKGWLPCEAPLGYLNDKFANQGERTIVRDPERFPLVRQMWELLLTGRHTPFKICEIANKAWGFRTRRGKLLAPSVIYQIFTNPFYYGWFRYREELHRGSHEPMMTEAEFWRAQELLGERGLPRPKTHAFAFTGSLIRCGECGYFITAEEKWKRQKNGNVHHYVYYHCTNKHGDGKCRQPSLEVKELEQQIDAYLARIQIDEELEAWALKFLNEVNDREIEDRTAVYHSLQKAYNQTQKYLDNLTQMRYRDLIGDEEYRRERDRLRAGLASLKERLEDTEHRATRWLETGEQVFTFACHAREWFQRGTLEEKRTILEILGSNLLLKDKKLVLDVQKPFLRLEEGLKVLNTAPASLEPLKTVGLMRENRAFQERKMLVGGILEIIRTSSLAQGFGRWAELLGHLVAVKAPTSAS